MKLCFIILAHNRLDRLVRLIRLILSQDCTVCLHLDKKVSSQDFIWFHEQLKGSSEKLFYAERVSCRWGTWSLVEAVLKAVNKVNEIGLAPDYFYFISGADIPIQPITSLKEMLKKNKGNEYIESFDINKKDWIEGGLKKERYQYFYPFNFQTHRTLFDFCVKLQKFLKIRRTFPMGLTPHFGSQWWCLTGESVNAICKLSRNRKIISFFKSTWIPDELFFQTLVRKVAPAEKITNFPLTFFRFNYQGKPILIYENNLDELAKMPYFFARKLAEKESNSIYLRLEEMQNVNKPLDQKMAKEFIEHLSTYEKYIQNGHGRYQGAHRKLTGWLDIGKLEPNTKPHFIILGVFENQLNVVSALFNEQGGTVCHGRLFKSNEIQIQDNSDRNCMYREEYTPLRDYSPLNFLKYLIKYDSDTTVGFCCTDEDFDRHITKWKFFLANLIEWDRNCHVFFIENSADSFLNSNTDSYAIILKEKAFLQEIRSLVATKRKSLHVLKWSDGLIECSDIIKYIANKN